MIGSFESSSITIEQPFAPWTSIGVLSIAGVLSNDPLLSILQNRGDPWKFVGEEAITGEGDQDGTAGQITVNSPGAYDDGIVFVFKFGVDTASPLLDTFFGEDFAIEGGEVKGYIIPEPETMSLLALGGLAVLRRRRRRRSCRRSCLP